MKKYPGLILLLIFFAACSMPYNHHEARTIVFKTPKLSYADAGFVHDNGKQLQVNIFIAGQSVLDLELGRKICLNDYCFKKKTFIEKYLSSYYDEDILHQIFLGQPIFDKVGYQVESEGFSQSIFKENCYQISYKVTHDTIRFKDRISKVLIQTKQLDQ